MNHTSFWKPRAPIRTSANSLAAVKVGQNQQYYCAALLAMPMGLFPCARTHAHTHTDTQAHMPCFAGALGARLRGRISWQCLLLPMLHVSEPTYTVTTQHRQGISPGRPLFYRVRSRPRSQRQHTNIDSPSQPPSTFIRRNFLRCLLMHYLLEHLSSFKCR